MTKHTSRSGFTLLETVLSLALTALLIAIFSVMTRQWIADWNKGRSKISDIAAIALAQERIMSDLEAAIPMRAHDTRRSLYFSIDENHIAFVREPEPIDGTDQLLLVEYRNDMERGIIRRTTVFDGRVPISNATFGEPVSLLESPFQMRLSYSFPEQSAQNGRREGGIPNAITLELKQSDTEIVPPVTIPFPVTIDRFCSTLTSYLQCQSAMRGDDAGGPKETVMPDANTASEKKSAP